VAEKLSKKELREPDAFMKLGGGIRQWLQDRVGVVAGVVAALVLGLGGVALADYFDKRGEDRAAQALGAALKIAERPVSATATTTGDDAPFKSEQEKDEAIKKAMMELRSAHRGTRAARTATLVAAEASLRLKQHDEAIQILGEYLRDAGEDDPLRAAALEGQGYAWEAKGDLEKALAAFEQLSRESKTDFLAGMGLYHRGRLLQQQDKKEEAAKTFADIAAAHPGTQAALKADERLGQLKAQGVKVPEPAPPPATDASQDAG
jgi:tetratricopeptide (TPR) repeat protein